MFVVAFFTYVFQTQSKTSKRKIVAAIKPQARPVASVHTHSSSVFVALVGVGVVVVSVSAKAVDTSKVPRTRKVKRRIFHKNKMCKLKYLCTFHPRGIFVQAKQYAKKQTHTMSLDTDSDCVSDGLGCPGVQKHPDSENPSRQPRKSYGGKKTYRDGMVHDLLHGSQGLRGYENTEDMPTVTMVCINKRKYDNMDGDERLRGQIQVHGFFVPQLIARANFQQHIQSKTEPPGPAHGARCRAGGSDPTRADALSPDEPREKDSGAFGGVRAGSQLL